jgi:SOS-response transcriptional repressor LexA
MSSNEGIDNPASTRDRIFDFLVRYKQAHDGNSPSLREIADACHIVLSGAHYHLTRLEMDGRIHIEGQRSRTIEIVGGAWQPPDDSPGSDEDKPDDEDARTGHPSIRRAR